MYFSNYTIERYKTDIDKLGLKLVWNEILKYRINETDPVEILKTKNFGELYEIGLAYVNKTDKKEQGKYYTPEDVADLMSSFFADLDGSNICDVCCGTGNLIISFLQLIGREKAREIILNDHLYLYDMDEIAMCICIYSIALEYGLDLIQHIHTVRADFLSKKVMLPVDCKVICNPPYYKISDFLNNWKITDVMQESKELYSAFMEKIILNSRSSVIITPFSFIGSDKFYSLRKIMNEYNGMIFSFDNVPGNIFCGRKHGIFNSNSSNSVRASITVVENKMGLKGFRISPLIRFQTEERKELLNKCVLIASLSDEYQIVSEKNRKYHKCFAEIQDIYSAWISKARGTFDDLLSKEPTKYKLYVPTTCRYFLSATEKNLNRNGKNTFYFNNEKDMEYAYCLLNSSFAYWYWRLFDGGITYPTGLLKRMPIMEKIFTNSEYERLHTLVANVMAMENKYLVYKKNASAMQENVKFPKKLRDMFNGFILETFGIKANARAFDCVHSNNFFQRCC